MGNPSNTQIPLANLTVSNDNPRFDITANQKDAIKKMLLEQGEKVYRLAKDILEFGMNPTDIPIVTPNKEVANTYKVMEGNRRIIALKLLETPDLINIGKNPELNSLHRRFSKLNKDFALDPIKYIQCVVFDEPHEAIRWISLKHTGENEGIGTVGWDSQAIGRFNDRVVGKPNVALQIIEFLRNENKYPQTLKLQLSKIPSSSLDRLVRDSAIQEMIGISVDNGKVISDLHKDEVVKGLTKITSDLITKKIKVKDIYHKSDREKYLQKFSAADIPNKTRKAKFNWELVAPSVSHGVITPKGSAQSNIVAPSTARKTLIPRDCILNVKHTRLKDIYTELRTIVVDDFKNATAVLFRVFVELSIDEYIRSNPIPTLKGDAKLHQKVTAVSNHLENVKKVMKAPELKGIRTSVSDPHKVLSINTFNAYVHNNNFGPSGDDLKITWNNIQLFMVRVWENIT